MWFFGGLGGPPPERKWGITRENLGNLGFPWEENSFRDKQARVPEGPRGEYFCSGENIFRGGVISISRSEKYASRPAYFSLPREIR